MPQGHSVKSKRLVLSKLCKRSTLPAFVVVAMALCSISAVGCGGDGSTSTTDGGGAIDDGGGEIEAFGISLNKVFCDIVSTEPVEDAAKHVLKRASGGRLKEGLLLDSLISSVSYFCEPIVNKAVLVGTELLGLQAKPVASTSDPTVFQQNIDASATAADIGVEVGLDANSIETLSAEVCDDLWGRRNANAGEDINRALQSPTLDDLGALNRFIGLTLDTCSPELTTFQMQTLTATAINLLTSNTDGKRDVSPPIILLRRVDINNLAQASIYWFGIDLDSGIASYSLWVRYGDEPFHQLSLKNPLQTSLKDWPVPYGYEYQFAVGAIDKAGNRSSWSYSSPAVAPDF
jgi:hypothetical protein